MLCLPLYGEKSFEDVRDLLAGMGLQHGMKVQGWPSRALVEVVLAKRFEA
jgi:hypothetical protein